VMRHLYFRVFEQIAAYLLVPLRKHSRCAHTPEKKIPKKL
jgi:hypothetical protein